MFIESKNKYAVISRSNIKETSEIKLILKNKDNGKLYVVYTDNDVDTRGYLQMIVAEMIAGDNEIKLEAIRDEELADVTEKADAFFVTYGGSWKIEDIKNITTYDKDALREKVYMSLDRIKIE